MINVYKKVVLSLFVFLCITKVYSQGGENPISKISIASPTAASLGKYGDIPVNTHTGIPEINIPIYTITSGPVSLPISLSYHASGLKVQEPAGWVGAGWSLNAGGVITRSVMGAPDEKGTSNAGLNTRGHFSDYGYNSYKSSSTPEDLEPFAKGWKDGEPDLFFFNIGGTSGKFYFRDDRTPVIVPEADFKIEPYYTGVGSIQGFTITASDGKKYYFGNTPGYIGTPPIEITRPVSSDNGLSTANTISSWYLNKISSADDQFAITLNYVPEEYGFHTLSMFPIAGNAPPGGYTNFGSSHGYELIKNIVQGVRLSQIVFQNNTVDFIGGVARTDLSDNTSSLLVDQTNQNAKPLAGIQIKAAGTMIKQINFTYSYFVDNSTPLATDIQNFAPGLQSDRRRLRLDALQEIAGDNSQTIPPYSFSYFNNAVPRRLSFGIDHWGFINGSNANTTLIPTYSVFGSGTSTNYPGADRDSHWPAMRGGTLQKITYPTGGNTQFDFESNKLYETVDYTATVPLLNLSVYMYGQATLNSMTGNLVTDGTALNLSFNNASSYSANLTIKDNNNNVVYTTPISSNTSPSWSIALPQGTYQGTLSLPAGTYTSGGGSVSITQLKTMQRLQEIIVGGNRISSIITNDGVNANNTITSYSYASDNWPTSGILYSRPAYVGIIRNDIVQNVGYWTVNGYQPNFFGGCTSGPDASYFKSPTSIRPMATTQGYHFGYGQVKVAQSGNGYTVFKYYGTTGATPWQIKNNDVAIRSINVQGCDANAPNYPSTPVPFDYLRGELSYQGFFNEAGKKVKEISYVPTYTGNLEKTPCLIVVYNGNSGISNPGCLHTYYELSTARKTKMQTTETSYSSSSVPVTISNTSYYESPFHHQVTRSNTVNSKIETMETKNNYAFDFRLSSCDGIANGYAQYNSDCASCLATYNQRTSCANNSQCLTNFYIAYQQCLSTARINYVNYRRNNFNDPGNTFQQNHDNAKAAADAQFKPILELQDAYQNPIVETSQWKNGQLLKAQYTGFSYSPTLLNKIYPDKVQVVSLSAPSGSFVTATVGNNTSIIKDGRYKDEASVKYVGGNVVESKGKDGVITSYIWGYNNSYPIVKGTNVDYNALKAAYTAVNGDLSQLRNYSSLSTAFVTIYTYNPLVGMTSETDANGKTTYYEYDAFNRLSLVRDNDKNVLKKICYNYAGQPQTCGVDATPLWQSTGQVRCKPCPSNSAYISNTQEHSEKDNNPSSTSYNTTRWIDDGISSNCVPSADWQLVSTSCQTTRLGGGNTGNQTLTETDINPCSPTYIIFRARIVYNPTACPLPVTCSATTCGSLDRKCINGICIVGTLKCISSVRQRLGGRDGIVFQWKCTYKYCFPDGTSSTSFIEVHDDPCVVTGLCQ